MRFGVLGTLHVRSDTGAEIRLSGPLRRQLLAALLCRGGRPASAEALIEDLWGELPPRSAAKTLQSHVARLRDDLGREGGSVVRTDAAGYRLAITADDLDALRFEQLTRDVPNESTEAALHRLDTAL